MISNLRELRFYRVVAVAALLLAGPIAPGLAQSPKDWKCTGNPDIPPDQQITGCTNAIQSGKYSGKDLTWAYFNRGNAYNALDDIDKAELAIATTARRSGSIPNLPLPITAAAASITSRATMTARSPTTAR